MDFLIRLQTVVNDYLEKNPKYCVSRKYIVSLQETVKKLLEEIS